MVMTPQPIYDAWLYVTKKLSYRPKTIYMSPQGKVLDQNTALRLKQEGHIIILCGHYEGIDERVLEEIVDEEISIGDYVLTGGELPAMVLIDCIGALSKVCFRRRKLIAVNRISTDFLNIRSTRGRTNS